MVLRKLQVALLKAKHSCCCTSIIMFDVVSLWFSVCRRCSNSSCVHCCPSLHPQQADNTLMLIIFPPCLSIILTYCFSSDIFSAVKQAASVQQQLRIDGKVQEASWTCAAALHCM